MRLNSFLLVLFLSACGGNSIRYVEVPGDVGTMVRVCDSDDDCRSPAVPDGSCDLLIGYCVRPEERIVEHTIEHGEVCDGLDNNEDGYVDEGLLAFGEPDVIAELGCTSADITSEIVTTDVGIAFLIKTKFGEMGPGGRCVYHPGGTWRIVSEVEGGEVTVSEPLLGFTLGLGLVGESSRDLVWTGSEFGAIFGGLDPEPDSAYLATFNGDAAVRIFVRVADSLGSRPAIARLRWTGQSFAVAASRPLEPTQAVISIVEYSADGSVVADVPIIHQRIDDALLQVSLAERPIGGYLVTFYPPSEADFLHRELAVVDLLPGWTPHERVATVLHGADLVVGDLLPIEAGFLLPARLVTSGTPYAATFETSGAVVEEFTPRPGMAEIVAGNAAVGVGNLTAFRFTLDGTRVLDGARLPDQGLTGRFHAVGDAKFFYYYIDPNVVFDNGSRPRLMRVRFGCGE